MDIPDEEAKLKCKEKAKDKIKDRENPYFAKFEILVMPMLALISLIFLCWSLLGFLNANEELEIARQEVMDMLKPDGSGLPIPDEVTNFMQDDFKNFFGRFQAQAQNNSINTNEMYFASDGSSRNFVCRLPNGTMIRLSTPEACDAFSSYFVGEKDE